MTHHHMILFISILAFASLLFYYGVHDALSFCFRMLFVCCVSIMQCIHRALLHFDILVACCFVAFYLHLKL